MTRREFTSLLWAVLVAVLLLTGIVSPQWIGFAQDGGPTDDEVNAIAQDLYCPVCENIPLDVCGTQACVQWRGLIRERLEQGWTEAEIKAYFVEQYGDRVLAVPPATRGINWLVYALPPVAFLAGAFVLFRAVRNWQRGPAGTPETDDVTSASDDPYVAKLEEELEARKRNTSEESGTDPGEV